MKISFLQANLNRLRLTYDLKEQFPTNKVKISLLVELNEKSLAEHKIWYMHNQEEDVAVVFTAST